MTLMRVLLASLTATTLCTGGLHAQWTYDVDHVTGLVQVEAAHFMTGSTGVVLGAMTETSGTRVRKTADGGATWSTHFMDNARFPRAMTFANATVGVLSTVDLATGTGEIHRSIDGGGSWDLVSSAAAPHAFHFPTPAAGFAISSTPEPRLYTTSNVGLSWSGQAIAPEGAQMTALRDLHFLDADTGLIVGGDTAVDSPGEIWRSTDGGTTWNTIPLPAGEWYFKAITFTTPLVGYVCGYEAGSGDGIILITADAGLTWTITTATSPFAFSDVRFVDTQLGYACDLGSNIIRTVDGGLSWTEDFFGVSGNNSTLRVLTFAGTVGYALGRTPFVVRNAILSSVEDIPSADMGFVVAPNPTDGGITLRCAAEDLPGQATLYDAQGRSVRTFTITAPVTLLDIGSSPGVHVLTLTGRGRTAVQRVIVR
jgi:photosystem II stability/assembly factor-like uncharacterized protein